MSLAGKIIREVASRRLAEHRRDGMYLDRMARSTEPSNELASLRARNEALTAEAATLRTQLATMERERNHYQSEVLTLLHRLRGETAR